MDSIEKVSIHEVKDHGGFNITYIEIGQDHPLISGMRSYLNAVRSIPAINPRSIPDQLSDMIGIKGELDKDTCKSKAIACSIKGPDGKMFVGSNGIMRFKAICDRHIKESTQGIEVDYSICRTTGANEGETGCWQPGHGEVIATFNMLINYGFINSDNINQFYNPGTYNSKHRVGVISHTFLREFIEYNHIGEKLSEIGSPIEISMYGHEFCCDDCASIFNALNIHIVHICPETHDEERAYKKEIHKSILDQASAA